MEEPDSVLNQAYYPMFHGKREDTVAWLRGEGRVHTDYLVCLAETSAIISAAAYLNLYDNKSHRRGSRKS